MKMVWILVAFTIIYLIHAAWTDLQGRYIYSTPCLMLVVAWTVFLCFHEGWSIGLCGFLTIHGALYMLMNRFHIWGRGDTDLFLLFAVLIRLLTFQEEIAVTVIAECLFLIMAMVLAILASIVEMKVRKQKWTIWAKAAVAPGFAMVCIYLLLRVIKFI